MKSIVTLSLPKVTIKTYHELCTSKTCFLKNWEIPDVEIRGFSTKKKIILTFSDISDTNEKIIFMYAGLQLTSFRCFWGFWKYIRCLMPKCNIKGNFSFQM